MIHTWKNEKFVLLARHMLFMHAIKLKEMSGVSFKRRIVYYYSLYIVYCCLLFVYLLGYEAMRN